MINQTNPLPPITGVSRSITDVMGIEAAKLAGPSVAQICEGAKAAFGGKPADRVFMYNPDAVALWLLRKYPAIFEEALRHSDLHQPMLSAVPSVTPVCFSCMYTGASPQVHGVDGPIKPRPILRADTLFDALLRAGKKPAIVATENHSMARLFLERDMDYYIYETYDECNEKAAQLIEEDKYDVIALYNVNFDKTMHRCGPESGEALAALEHNTSMFSSIVRKIEKHWQGHRTMVGFAPDHGCHEIEGGAGKHGTLADEDMHIIHLYKFIAGREAA